MQIVTDVHMINDFAVWPVSVTNATSSRSVFWLESVYKLTQLPLSIGIYNPVYYGVNTHVGVASTHMT